MSQSKRMPQPPVESTEHYQKYPGTEEWIQEVNTYHPTTPEKVQAYEAICEAAKEFMRMVFKHTPRCADQGAAIQAIREARMLANSAVALDGLV